MAIGVTHLAASLSTPFSGYLVWELVRRRLTGAYAAALVGPLWQLAQPALGVIVLTLVFSRWVSLDGSEHPHGDPSQGQAVRYGILLCCGLLPWRSMSQGICASANLFVVNAQFLRRTRVSPIIYVWVELVAAALQFIAIFGIFLTVAICTGLEAQPGWLQLVPLAMVQLAICFGVQLASAAAGVFVRDLQHVYSVAFQILFWVTPIAYRPDVLSRAPGWILAWNPLWYLVRSYREVVVQGEWLAVSTWLSLFGAAGAALLLGWLIYRQLQADIPDFV